MILTIVVFIIVLSILIFVHELGHFLMAKRAGVGVEEFGMGLPPRVYGKKIRETIYSINLLPFGGFVKLVGEDFTGDLKKAKKDPKNFLSKRPSIRASIIIAGIVMNLFFASIFYQVLLSVNNFKSQALPYFSTFNFRFGQQEEIETVVVALSDGSPAQQGGIKFGESIIAVDSVRVDSVDDIRSIISKRAGQKTTIYLKDITVPKGEIREVSLTPVINEEGDAQIGVGLSPFVRIVYKSKIERVLVGPLHSYNVASYTVKVFSELIRTAFQSKDITPVASGVSGPVGIFAIFQGVMELTGGQRILNLIDFIALLSLSLAMMNLLPFPALDGGRLVFVVFEAVTKKEVPPIVERWVHTIGLVVLLLLLGLVTFSDIARFR